MGKCPYFTDVFWSRCVVAIIGEAIDASPNLLPDMSVEEAVDFIGDFGASGMRYALLIHEQM